MVCDQFQGETLMIKKLLLSSLMGMFMFGSLAQATPMYRDSMDVGDYYAFSNTEAYPVFFGSSKLSFSDPDDGLTGDRAFHYGMRHSFDFGGKYVPFTRDEHFTIEDIEECRDDCADVSIPEPGTLGLFGLALLLLGIPWGVRPQ
jgi:hypothetical protein